MTNLQLQRAWALWDGHRKQYIGNDSEPARNDNLSTFVDVSQRFHLLANDRWPVMYSLAVDLKAADCIAIDLINAWDAARECPVEGAAKWLADCSSYSELCHEAADGERAIRIIARGQVPQGSIIPPRVTITTSGLVTITTDRIAARQSFQLEDFRQVSADNGGRIRNVTEAIAHLCMPKRPDFSHDALLRSIGK